MNERTTIGGVTYESVGSSSANLLLKCNGTARIQWGTKLIDLIKNGKIVSDQSQLIYLVEDESEINKDGIYIINFETPQIWVCKDNIKYNLTGTDLCIFANTEQNLTSEQKTQALYNIGVQYNTIEDLENSNIQNGIAYVINTKTLYTIKDGIVEEFSAKLKTITVDKEEETGESINSPIKIVLSILDEEYLILADNKITINYPLVIKDSIPIKSQNYSSNQGFSLYTKGGVSYLDVDIINVRNGLPFEDYITITYNVLKDLIINSNLVTHKWYLISDFQNHWRIPSQNPSYNRPILVRALTNNTLYPEGELFDDRRIKLKYDYTFNESIKAEAETFNAKGRIIWMKDINNNEANFDFLDYFDSKNQPLTTLHPTLYSTSSIEKSIFPRSSYNNKLYIENLYGTVLDKDGNIDNTNTVKIDFQFIDFPLESEGESIDWGTIPSMIVHDNTINNCGDLIINCDNFSNNTINTIFNSTINNNITNNTFKDIKDCEFNGILNKNTFANLSNCIFGEGTLENIKCYSDIQNYNFNKNTDSLLYDVTKDKVVYFTPDKGLEIIIKSEQSFFRGMIVMHSGTSSIPEGWAICDGTEYYYEGVKTITPNLTDKFIKAVTNVENIGEGTINLQSESSLIQSYYSLIFIIKL